MPVHCYVIFACLRKRSVGNEYVTNEFECGLMFQIVEMAKTAFEFCNINDLSSSTTFLFSKDIELKRNVSTALSKLI